MTERTGGYVTLPQGDVYVEEHGEGRTLLCVHGLGGGGHFFSLLGPALGHHCRVVALDLPGSGLSPAGEQFSFDAAADIVVALARRKGWTQIGLVGHSMGTIVALEVVRRAPDLVDGLLAVCGLPEPLGATRARLAARVEKIRTSGSLAGLGAGVIAANVAAATRRDRPALVALQGRLFDLQSPVTYAATAAALAEWQARPLPALDGICCGAVTGSEDTYAPPAAVAAFVESLPAGTTLTTLPDCGHLPFFEQPGPFADAVAAWLGKFRAAVNHSGFWTV